MSHPSIPATQRVGLFVLGLLLLGLVASATAQQRDRASDEAGEPGYSLAFQPLIDQAERSGRTRAEAAARRAVGQYLGALQQGDVAEAQRWLPTEGLRGGDEDQARSQLVWQALTIESFVVEEARVFGEREGRVLVRWQASFDRAGYAERLLAWQRERALALGIAPSAFDRRLPGIRSMVARAAERLQQTVEQPSVRLRLRPANPDSRLHPLEHDRWRIEDTFLPPVD